MLRVTTELTGSPGGPYFSTTYYGGTGLAMAQPAADSSRDFWFQLQNFLDSRMSLVPIAEVEEVDPATGLITAVYNVSTTGFTFAGAGEALPTVVQGLLRLRTGVYVGGREVRGRKFIPGILESSTTAGRPSVALLNAINGAWDASVPEAAAAGEHVVYSETHHVDHVVTSRSTWTEFAVLRSRRD